MRHSPDASLFVRARVLLLTAVLLVSAAATSYSQSTTLYSALVAPANPQAGVVSYLQQITLGQGDGTYTVSGFNIGINFTDGTLEDYGVIVAFYTGLDLSPSAANAIAGATTITTIGGTLSPPGQPGNFTYTFTLNSNFTLPTNVIGVGISLTNAAFDAYQPDMNGRFTSNPPTVGSSNGFVWNDANQDGVYAGSEQTTFGMSQANIRFALTGAAPIPEPSTWALLIGGLGTLAVSFRRRRG